MAHWRHYWPRGWLLQLSLVDREQVVGNRQRQQSHGSGIGAARSFIAGGPSAIGLLNLEQAGEIWVSNAAPSRAAKLPGGLRGVIRHVIKIRRLLCNAVALKKCRA